MIHKLITLPLTLRSLTKNAWNGRSFTFGVKYVEKLPPRTTLISIDDPYWPGAQGGWVSRNGQGQGCITTSLAKFGQVSRGDQMIWVAVLGGIKTEEVNRN